MSHTTQTSSNEKVFPEDMHLQCAEATHNNVPTFSAEEESKLYRKIDLRLLVIAHYLSDMPSIADTSLEDCFRYFLCCTCFPSWTGVRDESTWGIHN